MLSVSNSTETARIDHGSDMGMYLDTGHKSVDESDGTRDCVDQLSEHRNVHSVTNDTQTTEKVAMKVRT